MTFEEHVVGSEGFTLSRLIWNRFKRPMPGLLDQTLEANPNLADLGPFLPVGTVVRLPIPQPRPVPIVEPVRLWN